MLPIVPILAIFVISQTFAYIFNTQDVTVLSHEGNRYFGYSLLLQKGNTSIVTVGAPKDKLIDKKSYGGEVFQCKLSENKSCEIAFKNDGNLNDTPNGDFLGATVNGEDNANGLVMVCSPRTSFYALALNKTGKYYLYGKCSFRKNSEQIHDNYYNVTVQRIRGASPIKSYIVNKMTIGYYDYGYAFLGFDISLYNKDNVLCGAPGLKTVGATILFPTSKFEGRGTQRVTVMPKRDAPDIMEEDNYFGYSVNTAKDFQTNEIWFIAGAPRANNLKGKVTIFTYVGDKSPTDTEMKAIFLGREFGSYYGASVLAVDLTADTVLDVLIGAPLTPGKTYDEGCVHFYKIKDKLYQPMIKLTGSKKIGSRFGTSITSLGDFDLDSFNDVAISAPYENDEEGAVYIYRGNADGLEDIFSQRLSPATFSPAVVAKGFGLGISRGNDIDHNGHNDIAIGAYKSDKVLIVQSYGIMEYQTFLTPSINAIQENTTAFNLEICLNYSKRSNLLNIPSVDFGIHINLDYRSVQSEVNDTSTVILAISKCQTYRVKVRPMGKDIFPFAIDIELDVKAGKNIIALGNKHLETTIPYAIGCSNDRICITGLSIQVTLKRKMIILGKDNHIDTEVFVSNDGDPAYQCELIIQVPNSIRLRNTNNCNKNGRNYTCLFSEKLDKNQTKAEEYFFDIQNLDLNSQEVQINISVVSFGENKKTYRNQETLKIPVIAKSTSYIIGNSVPGLMELSRTREVDDIEVIHRFDLGKTGPSPLKLNVTLLIPMVEYQDEKIFRVLQIKGSINEDPVICVPATSQIIISQDEILDGINQQQIPQNQSIMLYCNDYQNCAQYSCEGRLDNSSQKAVFEIRSLITSKLIVKKFRYELRRKDIIAYLPVAVQLNNLGDAEDRVLAPAQFIIVVQNITYIPLWTFIVGTVIGLMLLILIVMGLYKCSFFEREYKDYIEEELIKNSKLQEKDCCSEEGRTSPMLLNTIQDTEDPDYANYL